jgi:hypothetical protein
LARPKNTIPEQSSITRISRYPRAGFQLGKAGGNPFHGASGANPIV